MQQLYLCTYLLGRRNGPKIVQRDENAMHMSSQCSFILMVSQMISKALKWEWRISESLTNESLIITNHALVLLYDEDLQRSFSNPIMLKPAYFQFVQHKLSGKIFQFDLDIIFDFTRLQSIIGISDVTPISEFFLSSNSLQARVGDK